MSDKKEFNIINKPLKLNVCEYYFSKLFDN